MIRIGEPAPDFEALTTYQQRLSLASLRGKPVVVYFFPKAFTPGWRKQAAQFGDAYDELKALGAEVIGISTDDHATQCEFAAASRVPFPMIADDTGAIAQAFGVMWRFIRRAHRVTFLIDGDGVLRGVFQHELAVGRHVSDVLAALRRLNAVESA